MKFLNRNNKAKSLSKAKSKKLEDFQQFYSMTKEYLEKANNLFSYLEKEHNNNNNMYYKLFNNVEESDYKTQLLNVQEILDNKAYKILSYGDLEEQTRNLDNMTITHSKQRLKNILEEYDCLERESEFKDKVKTALLSSYYFYCPGGDSLVVYLPKSHEFKILNSEFYYNPEDLKNIVTHTSKIIEKGYISGIRKLNTENSKIFNNTLQDLELLNLVIDDENNLTIMLDNIKEQYNNCKNIVESLSGIKSILEDEEGKALREDLEAVEEEAEGYSEMLDLVVNPTK